MMKPLDSTLAALALSASLALPISAQTITVGLSLPKTIEGIDFVNGLIEP